MTRHRRGSNSLFAKIAEAFIMIYDISTMLIKGTEEGLSKMFCTLALFFVWPQICINKEVNYKPCIIVFGFYFKYWTFGPAHLLGFFIITKMT